jgi:hypothetical protein
VSDRQTLLSIIAHARSGAVDYAWHLLCDAGLDRVNDDPAVLSVVGRLLKDRALVATGEVQQRLYLDAAAAYFHAGAIGGATYPLINAATLSLLAGHRERSITLARQVLTLGQQGEDEAETPYYRAATRAEALLLLGDIVQAKAALAKAMSLAPLAYEDHASTLRQFGLILKVLGEDAQWLDTCRPPRCLHYAGHLGVAAENEAIEQQIRTIIEEERIGFGFGALAAGADILIAEALVEQGAELHLLLPTAPALFRETSVVRFGGSWGTRFDRVLKAADSVRSVRPSSDSPSPLALQLAAEVAMGRTAMQAAVLMTEPVQLVLLDPNASAEGEVGSSQWICSTWKRAGRRQRVLTVPRSRLEVGAEIHDDAGATPDCLAAMLRIVWSDADVSPLSKRIIARLAEVVASGQTVLIAPRWTGEALHAAYRDPADAASIALSAVAALAGVADLSVAGHYGIVSRMDDPFGGAPLLLGPGASLSRRIVASTPPGAIHLTEDFAAALHAEAAGDRLRTEYIGDLPATDTGDPLRLFALRAESRG